MKAYCIYCGAELEHSNVNEPYCSLCGGLCSSCNRASFTDKMPIYCHLCGAPVYVEESDPICDDCKAELREICPRLK